MIFRSRLAPEPYFVEFVSDEMTSIAGYSAGDFIGPNPKRKWPHLIHPDDIEASRAAVVEALPDGSITEVEYRVRRADGSYAWILSRLRKFVHEDGSMWCTAPRSTSPTDTRRRTCAAGSTPSTHAEEYQESRARIVEAGDEARRRLERDLHDGAQQRLIISLMALRQAAKDVVAPQRDEVPRGRESSTPNRGLRSCGSLARGIHPSNLTEHGLAHAVRQLAERTPFPVEVDVPEGGCWQAWRRRSTSRSPRG